MRIIHGSGMSTIMASPANFTGRVWRTDYLQPPDLDHLAGSKFLYEPGARSFWHMHEREQAIVGVYGNGLVSWEGLQVPAELRAGDWWHVEPGVPHWHGASPTSAFAHLAVTAGGPTIWLHEVSESDYRASPPTGHDADSPA
ncbi:cupin domain-containing protein [Jatrophihabitans telluris]|uniref:Cupin domain-containing protein n=1 Tax=Jatrophihabitans telluris TaxID=2038343 RepID=A0ABY4R1X4_9ACTN|nr:cupin domain-containing protein [Jatrophihabitans telluris]UQX89322.1 cupin domain-containing protein [Jatrophihabitans telluris]